MATAIVQVYDKKLKLSSKKSAKFKYDFKICRIQGKRKCIKPFSMELSQHDRELGKSRITPNEMFMEIRDFVDQAVIGMGGFDAYVMDSELERTPKARREFNMEYGESYGLLKTLDLDDDEINKLGEMLWNVSSYKSAGYIDILEE